jgi:hypothetical protein
MNTPDMQEAMGARHKMKTNTSYKTKKMRKK